LKTRGGGDLGATAMKINAFSVSIALVLTVYAIRAQDTGSRWHNVRGVVVDEIGRPAAIATVYLKDVAGHRLRMKQTDQSGRFRFGLVNTDRNYVVYAEQANLISKKLPIPSDEPKRDIVVKLVLKN
jgi:hypothetical protein